VLERAEIVIAASAYVARRLRQMRNLDVFENISLAQFGRQKMRAKPFGIAAVAVAAVLSCSSAWAQVQVNAPGVYVGVGRSPWFTDPAVRRELKVNETQYNRLVKDYNQAYETYNSDVAALKKDLTEAQRRQRMLELSNNFYGTYSKSLDDVFTEPAARRRYNQLFWQYRGYGAFDDPTISKKLDLTAEQRESIRRYEDKYNRELAEMRTAYAKDRPAVGRRYASWWKQTRDRINSTLTAQQRQAWSDFVGDPYDFPVTVYFGE
jgi:Spy/CpxP family protein refolding chaperone